MLGGKERLIAIRNSLLVINTFVALVGLANVFLQLIDLPGSEGVTEKNKILKCTLISTGNRLTHSRTRKFFMEEQRTLNLVSCSLRFFEH